MKYTCLVHLEAFSLLSTHHEALIVCLGAPLVASKAEADIATGEAFRAVLWCALAALGGTIAVTKLAFESNAPIHVTHLDDHDLGKELSQVVDLTKSQTPRPYLIANTCTWTIKRLEF